MKDLEQGTKTQKVTIPPSLAAFKRIHRRTNDWFAAKDDLVGPIALALANGALYDEIVRLAAEDPNAFVQYLGTHTELYDVLNSQECTGLDDRVIEALLRDIGRKLRGKIQWVEPSPR